MWCAGRVFILLSVCICALTQAHAAEKMQTRLFHVPPQFTSIPFSLTDPPEDVRKVLEKQGVSFPKGATADLHAAACLLAVRNTPANLALAQAFVRQITMAPVPCVTTLVTVIEGPEGMIREAEAAAARSSDADATQQLTLLLDEAKRGGAQVRVVGECFLEAKTGTRATSDSVREHTTLAELEAGPQGGSTAETETLREGLMLQHETMPGSDGKTLDVSFSLELPVAGEAQAVHPLSGKTVATATVPQPRSTILQSQLTLAAGHTRLVGMVKPAADEAAAGRAREGALWAAFFTMKVREAVPPDVGHLIDEEDSDAPGLMAAVFKVPQQAIQTPLPLKVWLGSLGVTFGPGARVSHDAGLLRVTNTLDNIVRVSALVERAFYAGPRRVPLTVQTFEAPAALVRGLARDTLAKVDDSAMLAAVEAAAARGEARRVDFIFLDSRVAERNSIMTGHDEHLLASVGVDAQGRSAVAFTSRHVGSDFAAEASVSHRSHTLEITFNHEMHSAMPETRRHEFLEPASKQKLDLPLTDFHVLNTVTGISLPAGGTKLLSMHRPEGRATAAGPGDLLWVTFLHGDPTIQLSAKPPAMPQKPETGTEAHWQAWSTRTFRVPQDFLARYAPHSDGTRTQAIDVLKAQSIPFPEGAEATFDPFASRLEVKNTNLSLLLVEQHVASLFPKPPARRLLTAQVLQGPGTLLRRLAAMASPQGDHRPVVDELLAAVKAGTVQHLSTARIETKADSPAIFTQGPEHEGVKGVSIRDGEEPVFEKDKRPPGWRIEIDEFLNPDDAPLERVFDSAFHTTAPQERREHVLDSRGRRVEFPLAQDHLSQIQTCIAMQEGATRLLSMWKPTGRPEYEKEDVLQVMFITCDALRPEE